MLRQIEKGEAKTIWKSEDAIDQFDAFLQAKWPIFERQKHVILPNIVGSFLHVRGDFIKILVFSSVSEAICPRMLQ